MQRPIIESVFDSALDVRFRLEVLLNITANKKGAPKCPKSLALNLMHLGGQCPPEISSVVEVATAHATAGRGRFLLLRQISHDAFCGQHHPGDGGCILQT